MTSPSRPNESFHLAALSAAGLVNPPDGWSLQAISRNHEKIGSGTCDQYVVSAPDRPRQVLYVGPDLTDLVARSRLFAAAYPGLACPIVAEGRHLGWHYVLFEYFPGKPAIDVLSFSTDGPRRVTAALRSVAQLFATAERPSTSEAARAELEELGRQVMDLSYWTPLDRAYLEETVLPFLREQLVPLQPTRRVTNGDFILRNLLIDDAGSARLIDYELGSDSHFHREDWLRLTYWDALPDEIRGLALDHAGPLPALRVYLALKQIVIEARHSLPQKAVADIHHWTDTIRLTVSYATSHSRRSLFWPSAEILTELPQGELQAQLFWMTDEGWSAERSVTAAVRTGPHQVVRFLIPAGGAIHAIRLDPMNVPGVATIFNFTIRKLDPSPEITYSAYGREALAMAVPTGDALACAPGGEHFQIIGIGSDPQLYFNQAGGPAGTRLVVEASFSLSIDPVDQLILLRKLVKGLHATSTALGAATPVPADQASQIAALATELHGWFTGEDGLRSRLMAEINLQRKTEQAEVATAASLTIAQSLLADRTEDLRMLREQISGYAATIDRLELALKEAGRNATHQNQLREEALLVQRGAEDQLGRLAQELAAVNERARVLAAELDAARR